MKAKIGFFIALPFLICLGIFIGDAITVKLTPTAKANNVMIPQMPCPTESIKAQAFHDPQFGQERFITFRTTGTCADTAGYGCLYKVQMTIWKSTPTGFVKVDGGYVMKGAECAANGVVQWVEDFAVYGVGVYKVHMDCYDMIPLFNPTLLSSSEFGFNIFY